MNKRFKEIDDRLAELRQQLRGEGEIDMDAIEKEINELRAEREKLMRRMEIAESIADGDLTGLRSIERSESRQEKQPGAKGAGFAEPAEYRDAWAAKMLGAEMSDAQLRVFTETNAEYRAYTHTTENTAVLIPETVVAGIWKRAEESYPLWNDVRKFSVPGTLTMKRYDGLTEGDAAWYDEPTPVADEKNTFSEINLTGCELAKSVTVSWKLRAMAISEFITFIEREIGERIGVALGNAVYSGKGKPSASEHKPEPRGVKTYLEKESGTPQITTYTGKLTEENLRTAVAKLHSSHIKNACVYVNNKTAWTVLAGIQDANKRPIFLNDVSTQGAVGRIFGMPVKIDAAIGDGEVLFASAVAGYWANITRNMTMHTEEHVKARTTDYMGYAIVDGDVYDSMAFSLLKTSE